MDILMANAIKGLIPQQVWKHFERVSRIPRGSKNEAAAAKYVLDQARSLGLEAAADEAGNVVVRKPASKGRDRVRPLALQCHLDMVCEKNKERDHDFSKDPIKLVRSNDFLKANGTTLGADNGIGIAVNLAIMEDDSLQHGPLELLFTVDEETGMTGALNLQPDFLESRTLLNLDSEEEGTLYVGCAGGRDSTGSWKIPFEKVPGRSIPGQLRVAGLKGGHSGLEIDRGRGNAIKIAGRALKSLEAIGARLVRIDGGNKHNAIPRECEALLLLPEHRIEAAERIIEDLYGAVHGELSAADPDLEIDFMADFTGVRNGEAMKRSFQRKLLRAIAALPHGVVKVSADIPGLVETSTNVAVVRTEGNVLSLATSQRSSVASELVEIVDTVASVFALSGASVRYTDGYPGWEPDMKSAILKTARTAYRSLYRKPVKVKAIHAGLECGVIGERIPGMDMVSFGPTIDGAHSPDERIHIPSVDTFWNFLLEILKRVR
jgi:dipeptidase D